MEDYINKSQYPSIWRDKHKISSYEVDAKNKASLQSFCNFLQESAWNHAEALNLGYSHLIGNNQIWVLSRLLIKVHAFPMWGDTIFVETWAKRTGRLFAYRDFHILDENDKIIAAASSAWVVIDLKNRRPQRMESFSDKMPLLSEKHALEAKLDRVPSPEVFLNQPFFPVLFSDLDMNKHVNNVKYLEWILDSYPFEMRITHDITIFEINFLREAFYGDEISVRSEEISGSKPLFLNSLIRKEDKREICRARIEWRRDLEEA